MKTVQGHLEAQDVKLISEHFTFFFRFAAEVLAVWNTWRRPKKTVFLPSIFEQRSKGDFARGSHMFSLTKEKIENCPNFEIKVEEQRVGTRRK